MKVDNAFAARVAVVAAEMVCDGWPFGTFDNLEATLPVGVHVESAMKRAAHEIWGGPGWWRRDMKAAEECLQKIRWSVCDDIAGKSFFENERLARSRWSSMDVDTTVCMLLVAADFLKST